MLNFLTLATEGAEGVSPDHIAADLSIPLSILIFCGSVYMLVWSNYGAKKGALIYGVAFFGFTFMLGVFWWFGAPGTPVATGLQNFPGQAPDAYQGKWYEFEEGSELGDTYFSDVADGDLDAFQTVPEFRGGEGATVDDFDGDPAFNALAGDVQSGLAEILNLALRIDENGSVGIGGEARAEYATTAEAVLVEMGGIDQFQPANPFYTAAVDADAGDEVLVTEANGVRTIGANVTTYVNYVGPDGNVAVPVNQEVFYAFKDPGAIWWPSAVWTVLSLLLFGICLFGLDRIEQREKDALQEVEEPERLAVPITQ